MKKLIFILIFLSLGHYIYAQEILNTTDVKIKTPLKSNWAYEYDDDLLNEQIIGDVVYINTLKSITAVSATDGKELWKYTFPINKGINSPAAIRGKYAVFTSYYYNKKNDVGSSFLTVIDLTTGKEKWSLKANDKFYNEYFEIYDENLYVICGNLSDWREYDDYYKIIPEEPKVLAFNLNDGKIIWEYQLPDDESLILSVEKDFVFVGYDWDFDEKNPKNKLLAISAKTGKELWTYNPSGLLIKVMITEVKMYNGLLFAFSKSQIACVDPKSGTEKWSKNVFDRPNKYFFLKDEIYSSGENWYGFRLKDGEIILTKKIISRSFLSELGSAFLSVLLSRFSGFIKLGIAIFGSNDVFKYTYIPNKYVYEELFLTSLANDKGLYAIQKDDNEVVLKFQSKNSKDDKIIESKFGKECQDLNFANGFSDSQAFVTTRSKVAAVNLATGKIDWIKDFEAGSISIGLKIIGEKMYLFTNNMVLQLESE